MLMYNSKNGSTVDPSIVARLSGPMKIPFEIIEKTIIVVKTSAKSIENVTLK